LIERNKQIIGAGSAIKFYNEDKDLLINLHKTNSNKTQGSV